MKITKTHEIWSYAIEHRKQMPLQDGSLPTKEKNFDKFTAAHTELPPMQNPTQTIEQVANALRKQYPKVSFTFAQLGDRPEDIPQFAVSAGDGIHLVIDPDILEWMGQGKEPWAQGLEMINKTLHDLMLQGEKGEYNKGAVIADDGEITLWSAKWEKPKTSLEKDFEFMTNILERQDEARKQQEEQQKKLKMAQKKKLNYQMGKDMARLAKRTTDKDVRSLISHMYASRQRIAASSNYSKKEVQTALAQMDYVIGRARVKIRHLKHESDIQLRIKKAEESQEKKRKMQLEQELKNRRRNRIAKERAAIYEKLPDFSGLRDDEKRRDAQAKAILNGIASGATAAECTPASPVADAGSTVVVSTPSGANVEVSITPLT